MGVRSVTLPVLLLITYIILFMSLKSVLPTADEIIATFERLYQKYGYEIIFVATLAEALVLVNLFAPGIITMAVGAAFSKTGNIDLALVILAASSGAVVGYILDYTLGYFGFSEIVKRVGFSATLERARAHLDKYEIVSLVFGFAHPNVGSFLSLAAGTIGMPFRTFLLAALSSTLVWLSIWGIIVYSIGEVLISLLARYSFLVVAAMITTLAAGAFLEKRHVHT